MNATGPLYHAGVLALLPCYCEPESGKACRALVHRSVSFEFSPEDRAERIEGKRWGRAAGQTLYRHEKPGLSPDDALQQGLVRSMVDGMNSGRVSPGYLI